MGELRLIEGQLDLASVNRLSKRDLRNWIFTRLHGRDLQVPGALNDADMPHYLLARVYPELNRSMRQDMEAIVCNFIHDMARNEASPWLGNAADELLLLAQTVCGENVIDYIVEMAQSRQFFQAITPAGSVDLHYRLLQSLVAFGWRGAAQFWQEQAQLCQEGYAGVAFDGLALISPEDAVKLLTQLEWTDIIEGRIMSSFPGFLEEYKVSFVLSLLERDLSMMPRRAQAVIERFLVEEGISLPAPKPSAVNYDRAKRCLSSLGYEIRPGQRAAA